MRCLALRCTTLALAGEELCDRHLEMEEEGAEVRRVRYPRFKDRPWPRVYGPLNRRNILPDNTRASEIKARARQAVQAMFLDREARNRGLALIAQRSK